MSRSPLSLVWDESNSAISSNNVRSFNLKGRCATGSEVLLSIGSLAQENVTCESDSTFSKSFDLDGITEGTLLVTASQEDTVTKLLLTSEKNLAVDVTPPVITFAVPDNSTNFPLSSVKANYPLSGTCSDPFSLVNITSTTKLSLFTVCSAAGTWQTEINLSVDDSSSIEFYAKHFDAAGNISPTLSQTIRAAQWVKISPTVTSTGVASYRQIVRYGDTGRILVAVPLRNDDFVDLGIVNYDNTGLTRISPSLGSWSVDTTLPIIAAPKYNRAFFAAPVAARAQLIELHSVKIDGSDHKVLLGPNAVNPVAGVTNYSLTPDQKTLIVRGDMEATDNQFNLYAISVATGAITKLNGNMTLGGDVSRDLVISPDSSEVIFRMDKDVDEILDLYAVKVDGTNLRKLNGSMGAGKAVQLDYKLSPDGNWVYYKDNDAMASGFDLKIASLRTGEIINLTNATNSGVSESLWSPDSKQIAFRADLDLLGCVGLYRYDIAGANRILLSTTCDSTIKDAFTYTWSADSSKIAFGNATVNTRFDLYIVDRDGSNKIHLTTAAANYTGVYPGYRENAILITPDNQFVLFQGDIKGTANANSAAMRFNYYSIKSDGTGAPVLLHSAALNTAAREFPVVSLSPTGDRLAFAVDLDEDAKYEMYLSSTDGSSQRKISPPIPNPLGAVYTGNTYQYFFDWGHDTVGMIIDENIDGVGTIYLGSLKLPASVPKNIGLPSILTGDITLITSSKNKQKVFFKMNPDVDAEMHLYSSDADGTNVQRLTKNYVSGGGVMRIYASTNDGSKVVYISDQDTPGQEELYIADSAGGNTIKISTPIVGDILDFAIAESAGKVFYRGGVSSTTHTDIYSVNFDGTGTTKITPNYLAAGTISSWSLSPDESYIATRGDFYTDEIFEVVTLPAAGGAFTRTHPALAGGLDALGFKISPDSAWVCYWGDFTTDGPIDAKVTNKATSTVYPMTAGITSALGALTCEFTPDSAYVIISGDWLADAKAMLKSFKLADQSLVTLNPGLPSSSVTSLYSYVNNVAAKRVITFSETSPDVTEIYSVNYDGTDLRKISQVPYAGGKVNANQGTAMRVLDDNDGTIVYSGLIDRLGRWDLFAVKWDGSSARKLVTLNSFADIYDFAVAEASDTILFRADNDKDGVVNLYSVKLDGTGLKNHTPGLAFGTITGDSYQQTNTHVIFRSDAYRGQLIELFADGL